MDISRRNFLKGVGAMGVGMGMMPILSILGVKAKAETEGVESAVEGLKHFANLMESDELKEAVLNESEVTSDLTMSDGTVVPAIYVRMRNRINRIGKGIGSIPAANSYQMIMELWSQEDAENYMKMPLHQVFSAANYAVSAGISEEKAAEILEDQAHRNLIWRMVRGGQPYYALMPYINGFWEFGELDRALHGNPEDVFKFDTLGISGTDPNAVSGFDTTFPLFRSYPISKDVVDSGELDVYSDWRAIIKRHKTITVSPCQCRTMWNALGVPYPEDHPMNTCLSLGDMAEYFIENDIGTQITQDEAIAIVEDAIAHGMVPEAICAKNPDIICCCHSESCGNLMGFRGCNGQGSAGKYYNAYTLDYDKDKCLKCGLCVTKCPMHAITQGEDGYVVLDDTCVRCGQCVPSCPGKARILKALPEYPELPEDYVDCNLFFAKDRLQRGQLVDFTDSTLDV